jgi:hypothetical protein
MLFQSSVFLANRSLQVRILPLQQNIEARN